MLKLASITMASLLISILTSNHSLAAKNELPNMGSSSDKVLPLSMEQELGDYYMRILRQQLPVLNDPQIRSYINELGFRLVAENEDANNRQFYFFVVNDPAINAFAMPGGYIAINSGLILNAETESELAGVVAHEIAHVTQRHIARRLEQQQQLSMPTLLATLGSILIMTQNAEAGMAAITGVQAGVTQVMINHTRTNESEADRIGIRTLANAGFDPHGMAKFFETLMQMSRYSGKRLAFLSTHPLSQARITEARDRARSMNVKVKENNFNFLLFKERLASFISRDFNPVKRSYENKIQTYSADQIPTALEFGYALTLNKLADFTKAEKILKRLYKQYPDNQYIKIALAEVQTGSGKPRLALAYLESAYNLGSDNDSITMAYANALIEDKQLKKALDILYLHLPKVEKEPAIYALIAEVQSKDGLLKEVYESTGLFLYYSGDLQGALAQFKMAMNGRSDDPYFNTRLMARLRKVQKEIVDTK